MKHSRLVAVAAAVVVGIVSAGCASSGGGTQPSSSSSSAAAATGSTWNIGSIASCSGAMAASMGGICPVIKGWAQSVNDSGGINGHKINLILKDDGGNPTTALTAVRELVEQDHVIAIVNDQSNFDASWASYVAGKGVPVVGGLPTSSSFISNPDFFNFGTNVIAGIYATVAEAKKAGKTTIGELYCAESPDCAKTAPLFKAAAAMQGVKLAVSAKVSGTAPDYTAVCLQLKDAGVEAYLVGSASAVVQRITDACAAQGVQAIAMAIDGVITQTWLKDKNFEGTAGVELVAPWFDASNPAVKEFQDAVQKYAPDVYGGALYGPNTMYAWASGKLFEAAAKAANLGDNPTPAQVADGLHSFKGETLGGLTAPLTFQAGKPGFNPCYFPVQIKNGAFVAPGGATPVCIDMAKLAPFLKAISG